MTTTGRGTHEEFLHSVREAAIRLALQAGTISEDEAAKLEHTKLVYGVGNGTYRGVCHYGAWENGIGQVDVIEVAATAEESWVQLAGTTIHELGHVLAGWGAGHSDDWKACVERLGMRRPKAAGQVYALAQLNPAVRVEANRIAQAISDGLPSFAGRGGATGGIDPLGILLGGGLRVRKPRPCSAGYGTKGGTSRGPGSGSRMIKVACQAEGCGYQVRISQKWIAVGTPPCGADPEGHGRMVPEDKGGTQ